MSAFRIPAPDLQMGFSFTLGHICTLFIQETLGSTAEKVDLVILNSQPSAFAPGNCLKASDSWSPK
jgi:hypothetical protein